VPLYYFNVRDGFGRSDFSGHHLLDLATAKREAVKLSGGLIAELGDEFWHGDEWTLEVTDADGLVLFSLVFLACVSPAGSAVKATPAYQGLNR